MEVKSLKIVYYQIIPEAFAEISDTHFLIILLFKWNIAKLYRDFHQIWKLFDYKYIYFDRGKYCGLGILFSASHLLIMDDDPEVASWYSSVLEDRGHTITIA